MNKPLSLKTEYGTLSFQAADLVTYSFSDSEISISFTYPDEDTVAVYLNRGELEQLADALNAVLGKAPVSR